MKNKKNLIILAIVIAISLIGVTYAFFDYYRIGANQKITAGKVNLVFNEGDDTIDRGNIFPETVEKARSRDDNFITFTVSGVNTTEDQDIYYEIMLNEGDPETGMTRFDPEDLVFDLIEVNGETETYLVNAMSYSDFNARRIWVDTITKGTSTTKSRTYKLRMWLNEDVKISDTNANADYPSTGYENYYASVKVSVYGDFVEKYVLKGHIMYDMSSLGLPNLTSTPIYEGQVTTITTEVPDIEGYNLTGWSTTLNGEVVYQPGDQIKANDIINNNITLYPVIKEKEKLVDKITSTISLTAADTDGTRFVNGADVDNNYVWYSGKLWRVVSIDNEGNIKLITQGNVTTIAWQTSSSTDYSTSQMRTWLNNEFLPTLHDAENLLVDYEWDYTTYTSFPTEKATENIMKLTGENAEKVGLLNIYEFMMTGGTVSSSASTFLNNDYHWWTISPYLGKYDGSGIWVVYSTGGAGGHGPWSGVRPSVNLKSGITVLNGTGEKTNPYTIEGDKESGTTSNLISSRISGEYIKFNNTKYRIVGFETINGQQLTKVIMSDYDINKNTLATTIAFGSSDTDVTYNTSAGIGKYLLDWYNATSENDTIGTYTGVYISEIYKKMIAINGIKWYAGPADGIDTDYTLAKTGTTISTPIGLGYYGEMFSSQFGDASDNSTNIWLMTKYNDSKIWYVDGMGGAATSNTTVTYGARPSFYLKSNVVIGDVDGDGKVGTGMPHNPYEIVQITE